MSDQMEQITQSFNRIYMMFVTFRDNPEDLPELVDRLCGDGIDKEAERKG